MKLPALIQEQFAKFRWINERFGNHIRLPSPDHWKKMTDTDIWIRVVGQVVVVGNSEPAKQLANPSIRKKLNYESLCSVSEVNAAEQIGKVLREIGTRYVSERNPEVSSKIVALVKNLVFLKKYMGGPRGFIRDLAELGTSEERWKCVAKHLSYIKHKGARDFLTTGFGLATDRIALDSRVMGVVSSIVPTLPAKVPPTGYAVIEEFLIDEVCKPLKIPPAHFDQLLYVYSREILAELGSMAPARDLTSLSTEALQLHYQQILAELQRRNEVPALRSPTAE